MGAARTIALKDLRLRIRDRTAILVAVILPLGLAWIFSLTLGGVSNQGFSATYAVADSDHGALSAAFLDTLRHLDFVTLETAPDADAADRMADRGTVDAAFVFPAGFSAQVGAGQGGRLRVIANPDTPTAALVAASLARSFASQLDAVRVAVATVTPPGGTPDAALVRRAQQLQAPMQVREASAEDTSFSATTFFAIGMAVFFLFFTVEFGVRGLLEERQAGTLARLLVTPARPSGVLAGKALASFAVGLVSTALLIVASTVLLDAVWGQPVGVALLVLAGVVCAVAVTALVSTLARTPGQAGSYTSIVAVVGGLLGGTFFPISQAGAFAYLRFLSPQGWLMEGFQRLASGGSVAEAAPAIAGTLTIGAVCGAVAWSRAHRLVAA